mmetsp:Transcript_24124/g.61841  ORF Transcript_24124/g.61841 Transcript_24124/m.61841 type:complete len:303 (+) Transcript_24124:1361-2269(+)
MNSFTRSRSATTSTNASPLRRRSRALTLSRCSSFMSLSIISSWYVSTDCARILFALSRSSLFVGMSMLKLLTKYSLTNSMLRCCCLLWASAPSPCSSSSFSFLARALRRWSTIPSYRSHIGRGSRSDISFFDSLFILGLDWRSGTTMLVPYSLGLGSQCVLAVFLPSGCQSGFSAESTSRPACLASRRIAASCLRSASTSLSARLARRAASSARLRCCAARCDALSSSRCSRLIWSMTVADGALAGRCLWTRSCGLMLSLRSSMHSMICWRWPREWMPINFRSISSVSFNSMRPSTAWWLNL